MTDRESKAPVWASALEDPRADAELFEAAYRELELEGEAFRASTRAVWTLMVRSTPEIFARACELLESDDPDARWLGIRVTANMNDPATRTPAFWGRRLYTETSVPLLATLAEHEPDAGVRTAIAVALEEIERPEGLPTLLRLTHDADGSVRARAAAALSRFLHHETTQRDALERLVALASDADPSVRDAAVFGLAVVELDLPIVRQALAAALDDCDPEVASDAAAGLVLLDDPRGEAAMLDLIRRGELDDGVFVMEAAESCRGAALNQALDDAARAGRSRTAAQGLRTP
jgi:HEAT repeat protein